MRAMWLPGVLRSAGLTVHEEPGWQTRGSDSWGPLRGVICHATGGSTTSTDRGEINVLLNGSTSAPPPIAQLYLSRSGQWWVIASGRCNHVRTGWGGPFAGYGNSALLGIEAQHNNSGAEPWTSAQYESYAAGVAAICAHQGWAVDRVVGHKEHQPNDKPDPTFVMNPFRARVSDYLNGVATMAALDAADPSYQDLIYRVAALVQGTNVTGGGANGEVNVLAAAVQRIEQALAQLAARPPVQATPIDAASLKAALTDPEVRADLKALMVEANELSEDS